MKRFPLVVWFLRIAVGGVFVAAGVLKAGHPTALAATIAAFQLLPAVLIAPLAIILPYFEIGLGGYLILGLFTRLAAIVAAAQLTIFAGAIASVVIRGLPAACGCFGPGDTQPASWWDVARDLALCACAIIIMVRPPGRFAVDSRLR